MESVFTPEEIITVDSNKYISVKTMVLASLTFLEKNHNRTQQLRLDIKNGNLVADLDKLLEYQLEFSESWISDLKFILSKSG